MNIIPGIKTYPSLPRFDSVEGWRQIADHATAVLAAADTNELLLENETAIRQYRRGEEPVDLSRLRQGLETLPSGIQVIWYPSIHGHSTIVQQRYEAVCKIVAEVLDARFVDRSLEGPKAPRDDWLKTAQRRLDRISRRPTIPIIYCYGDDRWWPDEQVADALKMATGDRAILYPGAKRWTEAARSLAKHLPRRHSEASHSGREERGP